MKSSRILFCLASIALGGCSSTYDLYDESPDTIPGKLRDLQGRQMDLALKDRSIHEEVTCFRCGPAKLFP